MPSLQVPRTAADTVKPGGREVTPRSARPRRAA